jgi:hypothetical protein
VYATTSSHLRETACLHKQCLLLLCSYSLQQCTYTTVRHASHFGLLHYINSREQLLSPRAQKRRSKSGLDFARSTSFEVGSTDAAAAAAAVEQVQAAATVAAAAVAAAAAAAEPVAVPAEATAAAAAESDVPLLVLPFKRKPGRPSKAQLQLQRQQQQASAAALAAAEAAAAAPPAPAPAVATLASSRPQRRSSAAVKQDAAAAAAKAAAAAAAAVEPAATAGDAPEVRQQPRGRGRPKKAIVATPSQRHSPRVARSSSVSSSSNGKSDAMEL